MQAGIVESGGFAGDSAGRLEIFDDFTGRGRDLAHLDAQNLRQPVHPSELVIKPAVGQGIGDQLSPGLNQLLSHVPGIHAAAEGHAGRSLYRPTPFHRRQEARVQGLANLALAASNILLWPVQIGKGKVGLNMRAAACSRQDSAGRDLFKAVQKGLVVGSEPEVIIVQQGRLGQPGRFCLEKKAETLKMGREINSALDLAVKQPPKSILIC